MSDVQKVIYMHRNKVNGKAYIGLTINTITHRWRQHQIESFRTNSDGTWFSNLWFHQAIRKYPDDVWEHLVLHEATDDEVLAELEVYYIEQYGTFGKGYNMTKGDTPVSATPEARRKGREAHTKNAKGYKYDKQGNKFVVERTYLGNKLYFGRFSVEEDAKALSEHLNTLSDEDLLTASKAYTDEPKFYGKGYSFNKSRQRYYVTLTVNGKSKFIGSYLTEQEAKDKVNEVRFTGVTFEHKVASI